MDYMPINIKTDHYLLNSLITIDSLMEYAKNNNLKSLGIANNNMFGAIEFYKACTKNGIKPIIGLEVIVDDFTILLYALNQKGYYKLNKIATIMSERTIDKKDIVSDDLIVVVPFKSLSLYEKINHKYLFKGYQNKEELALLSGDNLIYIPATLVLHKEDKIYLKYLHAIKDSLALEEVKVTDESILALDNKTNLKNNKWLVDNCNIQIKKEENILPTFDTQDSSLYLKELCKKGLKDLFGERVSKVYIDRLKYELDIINKMGFNDYFLIVSDYVKYAKDHNILVGPGRGSAAGSLVSYCLKITDIDPIKNHLLFERFLNPERISMPDIDIDFEDYRRDEVVNYCINKYGLKRVVGIITFGTLGSKQVIRDVGKVAGLEIRVIDQINKYIDSSLSLKENYDNNKKLVEYLSKDEALINAFKVSLKLEGLKRHTSVHAAGIVMASRDLDEVIPLHKHHDGLYLTGYTMDYLEDLGLLKMDFLALRNLTLLNQTINDLKKDHINIDLNKIPMDDSHTYQLFKEASTMGIFQFESYGMMNFLRKFKPSNFEDIAAAVALFRPGPINNIDSYIKRKNGLEKIDYFHDNLRSILEPTYGIIIYQEQIMQIASVMAGYSLGEADVLRRAMSKKKEDVLLKEKDKFVNRSLLLGYTKELSSKVYDLILKFADYGFNRAHACSYALVAYRMAYLKANYPKYFMKSLLNLAIGSDIKTKDYIYEARLHKINILKPDINLSSDIYTLEDTGIRYPLNSINNVGVNATKLMLEERKKSNYIDIYDFVRRLYGKAINKKTIESLIMAGVFDHFGYNKKTLDSNLEKIINYAEIAVDDTISKPEIVIYQEYDKKELMVKELETFGFYFTNHPVTEARLKYPNSLIIDEVTNYFDKDIEIVLLVDSIREIDTKKKDKMQFLSGSDELSTIDLVMFPKTYEKAPKIDKNDLIYVKAKVEKRFDKYQLIVSEIKKID